MDSMCDCFQQLPCCLIVLQVKRFIHCTFIYVCRNRLGPRETQLAQPIT